MNNWKLWLALAGLALSAAISLWAVRDATCKNPATIAHSFIIGCR